MSPKNIEQIKKIIYIFKHNDIIVGHFGALVANIAVVLDVAKRFVDNGLIKIVLGCLKITTEREAAKHLVAAIHNLSDVEQFVCCLCDCGGIEILRSIEENFDDEIQNLVVGIFQLGSLPSTVTTSLHASVMCCSIETVVDVLQKFGHLEEKDSEGKTSLELALENKKYKVVQILLGSGANLNKTVAEKMCDDDQDEEMESSIRLGKAIRCSTKQSLQKIIFESQPKINADVCSLVHDCIPGVDLLLELC